MTLYQLGIIYNIGDILKIGRFSSSGDNFFSDSGDCLLIWKTDFHPKNNEMVMRITFCINLRALQQLSFSDRDESKTGTNPRFFIGAPSMCRANA